MTENRIKSISVLGVSLANLDYEELVGFCEGVGKDAPFAVDFANTHILTLRLGDERFLEMSNSMDLFAPDGMPLVWAMNDRGAGLADRVYGPTFLRRCVEATPAPASHYFLGGSEECGRRLIENLRMRTPDLKVAGSYHGDCDDDGRLRGEDDETVVREINEAAPDFIWVGLGAPKQYAWIHRNKKKLRKGVILAVGYAFDVNAGTKADAPMWMQKTGLTWLFRLLSEPKRLAGRYARHNCLFLYHLFREMIDLD